MPETHTWPHAPSKLVTHPGTYIITASTLHKEKLFNTAEKLDYLQAMLLQTCDELGWQLQAWAVFPNHYHIVGFSPKRENAAEQLTRKLHGKTAIDLNKMDQAPGRTVWFRSWDTRLTFERSYLARLAYVHNNPVKHGLVKDAIQYRWCSARWFAEQADRSFHETVVRVRYDKVSVVDDF